MIDTVCLYLLPLQSLLASQSLLVSDWPDTGAPCPVPPYTANPDAVGFTPSTNRGNLTRLLSRCDRGCRPRYQFGP